MLRDGNPDTELLREDKYHLSNNGISQLSANLKRAIHFVLNIPLPTNRGRSLSRNRRGVAVVEADIIITSSYYRRCIQLIYY